MGKHIHSKDKLYILQSEYRRNTINKKLKSRTYSILPFNYCRLSLKPFNNPYCDENGLLYDKESVIEEMKKENKRYNININNLIKANFYKHNGKYICPVTRKYFNERTKIILNKKTGNVFSSEIFKMFKNKNDIYDPLTHELIDKNDLIILQDPLKNYEKNTKEKEINENQNENVEKEEEEEKEKEYFKYIQPNGTIINILNEVKKIKNENKKKIKKNENENKNEDEDDYLDDMSSENEIKIKCIKYSDNTLSQSVTSTIAKKQYKNEFKNMSENEIYKIIYEDVQKKKKKCYLRLITDLGFINVEIYTSIYMKLCHNFLFLCEYKYYDQTEIFKKEEQNIIYFGSNKKNYHFCASGFYWRKKKKKKKIRNKLNDQNLIKNFKESLFSIKSDQDSDIDIKYIKYNDNRHINKDDTFGNIYLFRYYNKKYSSMFYITLSNNYLTDDICIGKVVGGKDILNKLNNLNNNTKEYFLREIIIYTNPFKESIKEMKEKIKKKNEINNENLNEKFIDENIVDNKNDVIGKYINWNQFKLNNQKLNNNISNNQKLNNNLSNNNLKFNNNKMNFNFW